MRQPIIIHVVGLGLVVAATGHDGEPEMRWSSDPDAGEDAPVCVFNDSNEIRHFLRNGIDHAFVRANSLQPIRVRVAGDAHTISKADAIAQGVPPELWNELRVGVTIFGRGPMGPTCENFTWVGDREDYNNGDHVKTAFERARERDISSPTISTHGQAGASITAGKFMTAYQQSIKPEMHMAQQALDDATSALMELDIDNARPELARSVLRNLQVALREADEQNDRMRQSLNLPPLREKDALEPAMGAGAQPGAAVPVATPVPEAKLFVSRGPSMG